MPYLKNSSPSEDEGCLFCRKACLGDDVAEHVLYRGENCFITLNLYPYNNGHLLVVPYQHTGNLEDLDRAALVEMMCLTQQSLQLLREAYAPHGFNIGINQGDAAGAGIAGHLHQHIVPRWVGDTNYMTVVAQTRTIPEWIDDTYSRLKTLWDRLFPPNNTNEGE